MTDHDAIVVGGGHNGLICAAYLARGGLDTLLVEARDEVGGCASTVPALGARVNICNCDHTLFRTTPVMEELGLAAHGLRYVDVDPAQVSLLHDGGAAWPLFHDVERTLASLALTYPGEVDGYRRYLRAAQPVAELVIELANHVPRPRAAVRVLAERRGRGLTMLLRWGRRSVAEVLRSYFHEDALIAPAVTVGPAVWGLAPHTPGTGLGALTYATKHVARVGRPVGGSGGVPAAVLAAFRAAGGHTRLGTAVGTVLCEGDRVPRRRHCGRHVDHRPDRRVRVRSPHDVRGLAPPSPRRCSGAGGALAAHAAGRRLREQGRRGGDHGAGVPPARSDAPGASRVRSAPRDRHHRSRPGADRRRARSDGPRPGRAGPDVLRQRPLRARSDPAPGGRRRRRGARVQPRDAVHPVRAGRRLGEQHRAGALARGVRGPGPTGVPRRHRAPPDDAAGRLRARLLAPACGHATSFSGGPLAALRGTDPELTRYETPVEGLYLTGAATFPGAGVWGASGRNAARVVLGRHAGERG